MRLGVRCEELAGIRCGTAALFRDVGSLPEAPQNEYARERLHEGAVPLTSKGEDRDLAIDWDDTPSAERAERTRCTFAVAAEDHSARGFARAPSGHSRPVTRTVLLVDDHPDVRRAARRMLEEDGFEVVAEGASARDALKAADRLRPGIVVLDVELPDADGVEVARRLTAAGEAPAVVLTSSRSEADLGDALEGCGALGFIAKHELSGPAIEALAA